jgi:hypothetical protein
MNRYFIRTIIVLTVLGIAYGQKPGAFPPSSAFTPSAGPTRQVEIIDPVLQMKAYTLVIPAKWVFDGAVMQGSPCSIGASAIFRIMSPDGISEVKMLPRLDWAWNSLPKGPAKPASPDCLPFDHEVPAAEVLKYMIGILGVTFVKDLPAPGLAAMQENNRKGNEERAAKVPKGTPTLMMKSDVANARVTYNINNIPVEETLGVSTLCSDSPNHPPAGMQVQHFYTCNAWVTRTRARQGQLDGMKGTFDAMSRSLVIDQEWNSKWQAVMSQKITDMYAASTKAILKRGDDINRAMQARHSAFMQGQEMRQRQHEAFLSTMQRGTDMAMNRSKEAANARSRMAGDWADYALDQQKRLDPKTGEISKDSAAYSYTWVDESGHHYQTNDVNDNPNGRQAGNWTLQQNIR